MKKKKSLKNGAILVHLLHLCECMLLKRTRIFLKSWTLSISLAAGLFLSVTSWGASKQSNSALKASILQCSELFNSIGQLPLSGRLYSEMESGARSTVQVMTPEFFGLDSKENLFQKKTIFLAGVSVSIAPEFRQKVFSRLSDQYKKSQSVTVIADINFALEWLKFIEDAFPDGRAVIIFSEDPDLKRVAQDFKQKKIQHLIVTDLGQHEFYADQVSLWVDLEAYRSKSSLDVYSKLINKEKPQVEATKIYLLKEELKGALPFANSKLNVEEGKEGELIEKDDPVIRNNTDLSQKLSQYILDHKDDPQGRLLPSSKKNLDLSRWIVRQKKMYPGQWWKNLSVEAIRILESYDFPDTQTQAVKNWEKQQIHRTLESNYDKIDLANHTMKEKNPSVMKEWIKKHSNLNPIQWWMSFLDTKKKDPIKDSVDVEILHALLQKKYADSLLLDEKERDDIYIFFAGITLTTLNRYAQLYQYILEHKREVLPRRVLPPQSDSTGLGKWLNNLKLSKPSTWWKYLPQDAIDILEQRNLQGLLLRSDEQWLEYYQKAFFNRDPKKKYMGVFSFLPKDEPNLRALQGWLTRLQRRDPLNWWRPFHPEVQEFLRQRRVLIDNIVEIDDESILLEEDL